ncbi:MAG: hypothetical protein CMA96_05380 [Euryarchaeota archaeon]|nr:hypothetical protein [Euryarchaeota archaeon]|tara:strand:+ start:256 stop:657 length:402 start_codon:yes stop_codon:yes gene_type:complete
MSKKSEKYKKSLEETYDQAFSYTENINDDKLDTKLSTEQSIRTAIQTLISEYHGTREQLLWTKWGQGIPRSESRSLIADLSAARTEFISYFLDMNDNQLEQNVAPAEGESAESLINKMLSLEKQLLSLLKENI